MLINRLGEDDGGVKKEEETALDDEAQNTHEYQTANELFELMAKNHNFQPEGDETLTTRDLVILYKNIDLGTKLMSTANEFKKKRTNQYVETIVYNDDHDSDSDISENLSNEDLHNVILVNNERLDLLNNVTPLEKILCHKYGNFELRSTSYTSDYDRQFLFKDPFIQNQLNNFDYFTNSSDNCPALPNSLLDYVCCKKLEDTYNFDLENIIRYVQRTIEQLTRISNGDYLTDKAKEKWREVINMTSKDDGPDTKILKASTSIPLHVERKITGMTTTWDEIIHSKVDIRYLTKILEKKISIEIPKFFCGPYKVLSKCCEDNVIISCKSGMDAIPEEKESESRVDVVFKLERSESGHVVSKISSIMVLQKSRANFKMESPHLLSLPCGQHEDTSNNIENPSTVNNDYKNDEVNKNESGDNKDIAPIFDDITMKAEMSSEFINSSSPNTSGDGPLKNQDYQISKKKENDSISDAGNNAELCSTIDNCSSGVIKPNYIFDFSSESNYFDSDFQMLANGDTKNEAGKNHISTQASSYRLKVYRKEPLIPIDASYDICPADELRLTMQRLNIQSSLPEENFEDISCGVHHKRKSPVKKRISSPYANKSLVIEDKKRKKLLEIRERREKKKLAMGEHCKVTKTKYGKATIMPQASNSVTKLSITNKSFYNSIYGQTVNLNIETKPLKKSGSRNIKKELTIKNSSIDLSDNEITAAPLPTVNSQKYVNRNYYLDDTVTEMMYLQMKQEIGEKDKSLESPISPMLVDSPTNKVLSQLRSLCSATEFNMEGNTSSLGFDNKHDQSYKQCESPQYLLESFRTNRDGDVIVLPVNTPVYDDANKKPDPSKTSVEFRKSIDKIYNLMNKSRKLENNDPQLRELSPDNTLSKYSPVQYSESGTSIKNQPVSSTLSSVSFEKDNLDNNGQTKYRKNTEPITIPKVIICSKSQVLKHDIEKLKNQKKKPNFPVVNAENPLKALSQLIHEFNNVQKTRQKSGNESIKLNKKESLGGKCIIRQTSGRKSRSESHPHEHVVDKQPRQREKTFRDREEKKPSPIIENPKGQIETKHLNKPLKREMMNIIDDYKEARGEAVRGPSKFSSRLNSLAQPKKSYVQAHIEDCQMRYGRNMMSDRLQKLNIVPTSNPAPVQVVDKNRLGSAVIRCKPKRSIDVSPSGLIKLPPPQSLSPIEKRKIKFASEVCPPAMPSSTTSPTSCYPANNVKPSILKKKMVAVESYIKTHYGNSKSSAESAQMLLEGLKSRVPVIPTDYKVAPIQSIHAIEESAAIGSTLHNIIETMIETQQKEDLHDLEFKTSEVFKDVNLHDSINEKEQEIKEENIPENGRKEIIQAQTDTNCKKLLCNSNENKFQSATELEKLENALTRQLSVSTFQKRLRMKNLTLTPKQSLQQVLVLQSGDVGSLIFKSSQNMDNIDSNLKSIANLTNSINTSRSIDLNIPIQTLKVNYAFPIHRINLKALNKVQSSQQNCEVQRESVAQADIITIRTSSIQLNQVQKVNKGAMCHTSNIQIYKKPGSSKSSMALKHSNSQKDCTRKKKNFAEKKVQAILPIIPNLVDIDCHHEVEIPKTGPKDKVNYAHDKEIEISNTNMTLASVDYTSSLDILTGLLNEIQKITTCQTMMANNEVQPNNMFGENSQNKIVDITDMSADYALRQGKEIVSITSLDKLRQLESNNSFYSYYISNDEDRLSNKRNMISEGIDFYEKSFTNADKEVNVNFSKNKLVDKFTDKPSVFLPVKVNHSTSISNSLIGIFSQPSTQSIFSINETTYSASLTTRTKIIELPPTSKMKTGTESCERKNKEKYEQHLCKKIRDIENVKVEKKLSKNLDLKRTMKMERKVLNFEPTGRQEVVLLSDKYDSMVNASIKIKRDVLVTVYSILVFTVFAALSFPKMLYDT